MDIQKIQPIINLYLGELKRKITLDRVFLFGSWAKGEENRESDIDLLILSRDFKKYSSKKRFSLLWDARRHPLTRTIDMDILGFTPEEFEKASPLTTMGEIKETGIPLKV